jgi:signal transduction histidine kinase
VSAVDRRTVDILHQVGRFLDSVTDLDVLIDQIMDAAREVTDAEASSFLRWNEQTEQLSFFVALGARGVATGQRILKREVVLAKGEGIAGHVAQTRRVLNVPDVRKDPRFYTGADDKTGFVTRAILAVPVTHYGRLLGVLEVLNKSDGQAFTDADVEVLETVASQAAIAVENANLHTRIVAQERLAAFGEGIAGTAHCVKNIVNSVKMSLAVVQMGVDDEQPQLVEGVLPALNRGVQRIEDLVLDMLSFSKERAPRLQRVELPAFLEEVASVCRPLAQSKGAEVLVVLGDGTDEAIFDRHSFHRCLTNLVGNAIHAVPEGIGRIELRAQRIGRAPVRIEVADNGCGMPDDVQARIFEPFFSTKGSRGTGLGLSVVRKIVQEHDAELLLESVPEQGTTFTIALSL